jgi:hypothetical protein
VFRDTGSITFPSHIPKSQNPACAGPDDRFLREHFRWCLQFNILGGDIREDYDTNSIVSLMKRLGLTWDGETPLAPMDDERWDSVMGKELWEDLMVDAFRYVDDALISGESENDSTPWRNTFISATLHTQQTV